MTESSTKNEEKKAEVTTTEAKEEKKVPVAAIAEQRAKTRAAQSEVDRLQGELNKAQSELQTNGPIDSAALSQIVAKMLIEERQSVVQEMKAAYTAEIAKVRFAAKNNLTDDQVEKVSAQQQKHPSLSFEQALQLARVEAPDVFKQAAPAWNRAMHGGFPVNGAEPPPAQIDYRQKMREAEKANDRDAVQHYAAKAFQEQLFNLFPHMRPRTG